MLMPGAGQMQENMKLPDGCTVEDLNEEELCILQVATQ